MYKRQHLIEHKVELTESEPVKKKPYPIPYKMQGVTDKEIEDMLAMGIIERSEAPFTSPLVLVKKPDGSYRVCVNFKDLNKITVFDPEPMTSPDDIFPKLTGSQFHSTFDFCGGRVQGFHNFCHVEGTDEIQGYAIWNGKFRINL